MALKPLISLAIAALLLSGCGRDRKQIPIKFDKHEWLKGNREIRGNMADNIVSDSILLKKTKTGVSELLGQPDDSTDTASRYYWTIDQALKVGPLGLGGPWLFQLIVGFDSTNY